jgi:hypothetical protein
MMWNIPEESGSMPNGPEIDNTDVEFKHFEDWI